MNLVDSSAWLEYFADAPGAKHFVHAIKNTVSLLVPSIVVYEVCKKILQEKNKQAALLAVAHMQLGLVASLDFDISLEAAKLSIQAKLPMADSIILATARKYKATLWTQDADFKNIRGVKYFPKK